MMKFWMKKEQCCQRLCFAMAQNGKLKNMDETHHNLSITGDKGGPLAVSYHNPAFQCGAARGVKSARHVTGPYTNNAAGEALPPFYKFNSSAKLWENFRVKVEWLEGLSAVTGRFGRPTVIESGSFYAVRPRGSMDDLLLNEQLHRKGDSAAVSEYA
jgi:hypothetical protein